MRERWEEGSVIGKPRSLTHRVFQVGFRQRFLRLALRTEPIISAWCAVAEKVNAIDEVVIFGNGVFAKIKQI